jgi:hypothetical protein
VLTDEKAKDLKDPVDDQIIDGGVVDNTGLDTLALLMDALRRQASATPSDDRAQGAESSFRRVLDEMRKRGVLLIEIDAGARPSPPTWPATSFSSLSKPVEALGQAGHRNASILREHNISHIREALDEEEDVPAIVGVVRAGFDCTQEGDVITAWALGHAARAQIYADFRAVEDRFAASLDMQLEAIARLHAARRFDARIEDEGRLADVVKTAATKDLIASASEVRLLYETYLEQSMAVDARQARAPRADPHRAQAAHATRDHRDPRLGGCGPGLGASRDAGGARKQHKADDTGQSRGLIPRRPAQSTRLIDARRALRPRSTPTCAGHVGRGSRSGNARCRTTAHA